MALSSSEIDSNTDIETVKESFFAACEENFLLEVQDMFNLGADVNWRDTKGWAGLHIAAAKNYRRLLELLLAQTGVEVNINIRTDDSWHLLLHNDNDSWQWLLHNDNDSCTPLMIACQEGHQEILRRLIQIPGVQINGRDKGRIPLYWAVEQDHPGCVSVLRELAMAAVDWNAKANAGNNSLTIAVYRSRAECLKIILTVPEPHLDLSVTDQEGRNVTHIAVENHQDGNSQRCLELLCGDKRVDPYWNVKNPDGDSPVMWCLKTNRITMATTLLANTSVDLDTVDSEDRHLEDIARSLTDI